jgi:hypothetical protein
MKPFRHLGGQWRSIVGPAVLVGLAGLLALAPAAWARKPLISYVDAQETFQLYDAEAGANVSPPPPVPVPGGKAAQFRWGMSPNGRFIVFKDEKQMLHLLDRADDKELPLPGIDASKKPENLTVSDSGLIAFDDGAEKPTWVYDSAAKQFVDVGLGDADPSKPENVLRQPRLSGDGSFMIGTCFDNAETACFTTGDSDSDVFVQNLAAKQAVPDFPDEPEKNGKDEEHPCINRDGTLIAVEKPNPMQKDIFLFQRSGNEFTQVNTPELNDPEKDDRFCQLSADGAYLSLVREEQGGGGEPEFKLYERSSQSFVDLPELPFDNRSTLSDPLILAEPISAEKRPIKARKCGGKRATLIGTSKRDRIKGTKRRDVIAGLGGNDVIRGLGGNDILCGGAGRDRLIGGKGADELLGGKGRDALLGGAGEDALVGGAGKDKLRGGPGRDRQKQ